MKRWETGLVVFMVSALPFAAACEGARSTSERVAEVEKKLSEELGSEVKITCPTMVDNSYHYCTAEVTGDEELVFPVRIKARGTDVDYTTKRWVTGARMVALGKHHLQEKLGITVEALTCPKISHMPDGTKVRCEATAEGVTIPIEVEMVLKVRKLSFEPVGGVVFGKRAEEVAHEKIHADRGVYAEVKCPQPVLVSVPGKRFECKATMPDDTVTTMHFLITGKDGQLAVGTEPPAGGGGDPASKEASATASADAKP